MIRVLLFAAIVPVAFPQSLPSVGVFLDFDSVPGAASVEIMKREVDSLVKGVSLNWRLLSENHGDEIFAGLIVLKFKGKCKVEPWTQPIPAPGTRTLGATKVVDGRVLPFSEVQCDEVRRALSYLRPEATQRERQRALGLALGRVVAHELYHVLAQTTTHTARGITKAVESLDDLVNRKPPPPEPRTDTHPASPSPPS